MGTSSHYRVLTIGGVIVLLVIGLVLLLMVFPAIQRSREAARRAACLKNLKQLGRGFQYMESALKRFPPSCHVKKDSDGKIIAMSGVPGAGWSWCVDLLPYHAGSSLYETFDIVNGSPLDGRRAHSDALAYIISEFHCPSFEGNVYVNADAAKKEAITNYKAIGGTHLESLNVASLNPTTPRYAPEPDRHPDGAIYPGSRHGINGFETDGSAHTVLVVESVEQNVARWTVGTECTVVGMPPVVTFAKNYPYYHPTGYTPGNFWDRSTVPANVNRTYLDWDYDANPYNDGGISTPSPDASGAIKYGPGSHHVGVTNHAFADGSVHAISNDIDAALYFFIITRNNSDPVSSVDK